MNFAKFSILLVEDDVNIRHELLSFLRTLSFENIYVASNGKEGLESFKQHLPELVLTDLNMPLMDGLDMSKKIKKINEDTPIILITSQFKQTITEKAIDIGIDAYLFKPISLERLKKLLKKYVKRITQKGEFNNEHKLLEEYKRAIDVSAAVTKTDIYGNITYANEAFCLMSGYTAEELIGRRHSLVKHPQTSKERYVEMWETITSKKVWQGRMTNLRKDKSTYYEYSVIIPIVDDNNKIVEFIAIRQNITDLYDQEQYLKRRIEEEVQKNSLETKFSVIGKMAAGITHEINTPLTYIRGTIELMLQDIDALDENLKQKEYLQEDAKVLLDGVSRIASIVESMREMASQTKESPSPNNVYSSLITALTLSCNKAKQIVQIQIQDEDFVIGMDKDKYNFVATIQKQRIEQVWVIIINNALDVLKRIEVFEERLLAINIEEEGDFILVKIQDNGGGINEDILPKIFDPFESTKEEGGIGIGLNVAKRIIEDHKGKIVASNHSTGALFEIYLPKDV